YPVVHQHLQPVRTTVREQVRVVRPCGRGSAEHVHHSGEHRLHPRSQIGSTASHTSSTRINAAAPAATPRTAPPPTPASVPPPPSLRAATRCGSLRSSRSPAHR